MVAVAQRSFAGGEIAPSLYARTDQAKYASGLRTCRNMIVQRHGGAANRPGLVFVAAAKESGVACRLIPFVFDSSDVADTYLLEFGDGYIRFYQDGARVTVSSVTAWANATVYTVGDLVSRAGLNYYCRTAHTSATATDRPGDGLTWQTVWYPLSGSILEIPTPYATADLADITFVQTGDVITLAHRGHAPRELRRSGHTDWELRTITFGPSIDAPESVLATGTGSADTVFYAVTAIKEGTLEESLAGTYEFSKVVDATHPATITWDPVAGAISYNVYPGRDGITFGLINSAGGLPTQSTDNSWADTTETAISSDPAVWTPAAGQLRNALGVSATDRAYNRIYNVTFSYTLQGNAGADGIVEARYNIYYKRNTDATRVLALTSPSILLDMDGVIGAGHVGPVEVHEAIEVPDDGYTTLTIDVVPEIIGPQAGGTGEFNVDATSGEVTWDGQQAGFVDVGATPDFSIAPPTEPALFSSPGNYPGSVTHFQQRLIFAGTDNEPERTWASRIGSFRSHSISTPLQADDAIQFTLAGRRVNSIRHLLDLGALIAFGTSAEQVIEGGQNGVLQPDAINVRKLSTHGSRELAPIEIDDSAVYMQGRGSIVRDLKPMGLDGYQGTDLTVFAAHLFEGKTLVDWAYQESPNSVVWAVRSDGVLLGLTYMRDQAVWGWHRHDTLGSVESVCVIPEGDEDAVYVVVVREIDGETVRYVERLASRYSADVVNAIFMDSALSYDGWHTGVVTMQLSGGTDYLSTEQLTLTASAATFSAGDVDNAVFLEDEDGNLVRLTIEEYTSTTVVQVRADRTVSAALQAAIGNGNGRWALAVDSVSGLSHLEGEDVAVLADGYVVSSPNNTLDHPTVRSVSGGIVTLDRPYAVIHVGLPYISDLETLDLDWPGQRTNKNERTLINQVGLYVQASRGVWAGRPDKVSDDSPLAGLQALRSRAVADTYDTPPALITDPVEVNVDASWNNKGRVLVRQVDPLPLTVLSISPTGYIT